MIITRRYQLVELMKHLELPLIAAEVGVAEGDFSKELLDNGIEKLYSIDNWDRIDEIAWGDGGNESLWHWGNYEATMRKLKPFGDKATMLKGLSNKMCHRIPDNSLGLAYIDCNHIYEFVMEDIENYYPKVVDGGIMAFHDYMNPMYGVREAVNEFCFRMGFEIFEIPENNMNDAGAYFFKSQDA